MKENISQMKYSVYSVLINAFGEDACADVYKKDCWKAADSFKVVQYATNIACLQTPLPTGAFADNVVERGWHCRAAKP